MRTGVSDVVVIVCVVCFVGLLVTCTVGMVGNFERGTEVASKSVAVVVVFVVGTVREGEAKCA